LVGTQVALVRFESIDNTTHGGMTSDAYRQVDWTMVSADTFG